VHLLFPRSRGYIKLRSPDPQDHPIIQPNYLTDQHDVDTLVEALKIALKITETKALQSVGAKVSRSISCQEILCHSY
jgi:choline dehydrogenase-like flavoprotein